MLSVCSTKIITIIKRERRNFGEVTGTFMALIVGMASWVIFILKATELYTLKMHRFLHVNHISVKGSFLKKEMKASKIFRTMK